MIRGSYVRSVGMLAMIALAIGMPSASGVAQTALSGSPIYKDPSQPIDRRVDDLLARMTLEEKAAQLVTTWEHKDKIQTDAGAF